MTMLDEWREGWTLGADLRHSRLAREDVLRTLAPGWSAAKLEGFLFAHEQVLEHQQCTCPRCPMHAETETTKGNN